MFKLFDKITKYYLGLRSRILIMWYGHYYKIHFGKGVRIYSKMRISGLGKIIIGDNVCFSSHLNCLCTQQADSIIKIDKECLINGANIFAARLVHIGAYCLISDANIMDTSVHGINHAERRDSSCAKISEVIIGDNVWVGSGSYVLPGVKIGNNSIVGVNSVCANHIPANVFAGGVPAVVIKSI